MTEQNLQETLTGAVIVPLLQASISGTFIGLSVGGCAAFLDIARPVALGLTVGALAATGAWLSYRGGWQARVEALLGVDINHDGVIGMPVPQTALESPAPVRVELWSDQYRHGDFLELPAKPEQLIALGEGITQGDGFTTARWTGPRGVFTRSEFEQLRAELIKRGFARWSNPRSTRQGVELTGKGRALMHGFALMAPNLLDNQVVIEAPTLRDEEA